VAIDPAKQRDAFRDCAAEARACVKQLYRLNHAGQTLDFVRAKEGGVPALRVAVVRWPTATRKQQRHDEN
jgi:hypothetical protein